MKVAIILLGSLLLVQAAYVPRNLQDGKVRYDNYKVFKISFKNESQRNILKNLLLNHSKLSVWHEDLKAMDIMVPPEYLSLFKNIALAENFNLKEIIPNLQSLIDEEQAANRPADNEEFGWTRYNNLQEINEFLDNLLSSYPSVTEAFTVAQSYEGRPVRGVKISYKNNNPGIFMEANIHAREWITSATVTWFMNELLTSENSEVRQLAENYDWYIIPVLNVDGFVYSHEKDRLWRKTRQRFSFSSCIGTDGNRNYDTHWMVNGGGSDNPCDETYAGPEPFSEPEVKGVADFLQANKDKFNIALAIHSYSQLVLAPYGHTTEEKPENIADLLQVGKAYSDAIEALPYKTVYQYGTTPELLYIASGATVEYAYNEVDIKIAYTVEMRDTGKYGFVLPPIHILPNCAETMAGIIALVKEAEILGYTDLKY